MFGLEIEINETHLLYQVLLYGRRTLFLYPPVDATIESVTTFTLTKILQCWGRNSYRPIYAKMTTYRDIEFSLGESEWVGEEAWNFFLPYPFPRTPVREDYMGNGKILGSNIVEREIFLGRYILPTNTQIETWKEFEKNPPDLGF